MLKQLIKTTLLRPFLKLLARFGLELRHIQPTGTQTADAQSSGTQSSGTQSADKEPTSTKTTSAQTLRWLPTDLKKSGFYPRPLVDIGAAQGTPQLYEAFPESFQVLIEPLKEHEPHLKDILGEYEGAYFLTAIGDKDGQATMNVEPNRIRLSSIHERTDTTATGDPVERREIPVTRLDTLMENHSFQPPFGLKIDAEGFEYQVIQGAPAFLRETQFVIAEVSVANRFTESYSFSEFTEIMNRNGFYL